MLSGHGKAAQFPISPASPLYPAELEQTDSSTAFSQALTACGALPERTLRLLVNAENSFKVSVAQQIADTFTAAGVPVEAVVLPWEEYTAALESGSFDLYYGEVRLRADWNLSALLSAGGSLNYGGWNDPQCESLLVECRTASDRAGALSRPVRCISSSQAPILPICFKTVSVLYEADVLDGLTPTAAEPFYRFSDCTVHLKPAA